MIKAGVATGNEVQEIFEHAKKHGYALPAINVVNTSTVNAVLESARDNNSPALYTEAVMANFALTQGISEEEVSDWKSQLKKAEARGQFGFTSFPVITSAYLG